jgi:hypothetical protein
MTMRDWEDRLNRFIEMTDREVLQDAGQVTHVLAKEFAESEFERYRIRQDHFFESDFDRVVKKYLEDKKNWIKDDCSDEQNRKDRHRHSRDRRPAERTAHGD